MNTLLIGAFLDVLMLTIACSEACLAVGPGMGVENAYIKKRLSRTFHPKIHLQQCPDVLHLEYWRRLL